MDPEFIKNEHQPKENAEFRKVLETIAQTPDCVFRYAEMLFEWGQLQTALRVESHGMTDHEAF